MDDSLCKGCFTFFASEQFEGYCSQCFKIHTRNIRQQQTESAPTLPRPSPAADTPAITRQLRQEISGPNSTTGSSVANDELKKTQLSLLRELQSKKGEYETVLVDQSGKHIPINTQMLNELSDNKDNSEIRFEDELGNEITIEDLQRELKGLNKNKTISSLSKPSAPSKNVVSGFQGLDRVSISSSQDTKENKSPSKPFEVHLCLPEPEEGHTNVSEKLTEASEASGSASSAIPNEANDNLPKKQKKIRCFTCSKRLGLTGIQCRCEKHFCALHIPSNKHDCSFDYRQHWLQMKKE